MSQKKAPLFEIRSGSVDALLLSPRTADLDALTAELTRRFADTPEFFSNDVIAIDVRRLAEDERLPIDRLVETLTTLRARAIGVVADPEQADWAQAFGLPLLDSHGRRPRGEKDAKDGQDATEHAQAAEALAHVRFGQGTRHILVDAVHDRVDRLQLAFVLSSEDLLRYILEDH